MRKVFPVIILAMLLGGCVGTVNGLTMADIAKQTSGVAAALNQLPDAPGDAQTQEAVAGYVKWAAFLASTASAILGATGK